MNGILVMDCVQTRDHSGHGLYGVSDRMITIKGRRESRYCPDRKHAGQKSEMNAGRKETVREASVKTGRNGSSAALTSSRGSCKSGSSRQTAKSVSVGRAKSRRRTSPLFRAAVLALVFAGMIAGFEMMTGASNRPKQEAWKYHTTVEIPFGETLQDVVSRYYNSSYYESEEAFAEEICEINSIPARRGEIPALRSGVKLIIPYFSTEYK